MLRQALATMLLATTLPFFALGCEQVKQRVGKLLVGSKCDPESSAQCWGDKQALLCVDGKYVLRDCKGESGCTTATASDKTIVRCSWSEEQAGEKCGKDEDGEAVCGDSKKAMVICRDQEVRTEPCRGPKGCYPEGDKIRCDISISKVGDPCSGDGFVCAEDKQSRLTCKDGKMASDSACRGPGGCAVQGDKILCDRTVVSAGDPCTEEGTAACSLDKLGYLECKGGKMTEAMKCKGAAKCSVENGMVRCDWSIGEPGEPCNEEGAASCSGDGKAMLTCQQGKLAVSRKCGCKVEGTSVICR